MLVNAQCWVKYAITTSLAQTCTWLNPVRVKLNNANLHMMKIRFEIKQSNVTIFITIVRFLEHSFSRGVLAI